MTEILVLGLGNTLMGDDGLGPAVIACLEDGWLWPETVTLIDGGTRGLLLLPFVQACSHLLVVDAMDVGRPAGTVLRMTEIDLRRIWNGNPTGTHDAALPQLLMLAETLGDRPAIVEAIGVQSAGTEYAPPELSRDVASAVRRVAELVVARLSDWGVEASPVVPSVDFDRNGRRRDAAVPRPDLRRARQS